MRRNKSFTARNQDNGRASEIPTTETKDVQSSLCMAVDNCDLDTVSEILKCGADPNSINADGGTALHEAVRKGHFEMGQMLVQHGVDIQKPDASGWTPKALAKAWGRNDIYELLTFHEHKLHFSGKQQTEMIEMTIASDERIGSYKSSLETTPQPRHSQLATEIKTSCCSDKNFLPKCSQPLN